LIDPIAQYQHRVKESNGRMCGAVRSLLSHPEFVSVFSYQGISLWDVLVGSYAPQIIFPDLLEIPETAAPAEVSVASKQNRLNVLVQRLLRGVSLPKQKLGLTLKERKVLCLGFEARQSAIFRPALRPDSAQKVSPILVTSAFSKTQPDLAFEAEDCGIIRIEKCVSSVEILRLLFAVARLSRTLQRLKKAIPARSDEGGMLARFTRDAPMAMFYTACAQALLSSQAKPASVIGADNSDLRARALFLVAAQRGVPTFHMTYAAFSADCWEEKYLCTGSKLVFSESQKQDILSCFDLPAEKIVPIGSTRPRAAELQPRTGESDGTPPRPLTFLLGSQPARKAAHGYNPLDLRTKLSCLQLFAEALASSSHAGEKVFWKSHPDESQDEAEQGIALLRKAGLTVEVIPALSPDFLRSVSVHVTFFSNLALDCLCYGIPSVFLLPVAHVPYFKRATEHGIACELRKETFEQDLQRILASSPAIRGYLEREIGNSDRRALDRLWQLAVAAGGSS